MIETWLKQHKNNPVDFAALDKGTRFCYRDDLYRIVLAQGFKTVSNFVYDQYYFCDKSLRDITRIMGLHEASAAYWFKKWGFPTRRRGGNVRNEALKKPGFRKKILALKGQVSSIQASKILEGKCCAATIRKIWKEV